MTMTNNALKALVEEYGNKIFVIVLDNNKKLFLGVDGGSPENAVFAESLIYKTVDGVDMFGVHRVEETWGNGQLTKIPYTNWLITDMIQSVGITDELSESLPDLNRFY